MTTKIDSIENISIGEAIVGTVSSGASILVSSTAYVNNFVNNAVNNLGLVLNQAISYTITGTKTFDSLTLIDGLASSSTSIGTIIATTVNILSSSVANATLVINGYTQQLQVSGTNTWSNQIVIAPPQNSDIPHTKILCGSGDSSSYITFSPAFSVGCIPRVFINTRANGTQAVAGAYNVTNNGFTVTNTYGINVGWFALGY